MRVSPFLWPLLLSVLLWGILLTLLPPGAQDFPLNDDWAFARSTFLLAHGDGIHYTRWASMPQLGQWLWAIAVMRALDFFRFFGESHVALRVSTIFLSWLGLWAYYDLLRQERISLHVAALATAALAVDPLFFLLEGTYMTDVPALSFALIALALYSRAIASGRLAILAGATAIAVLGVVTRQNAVVVPLVAAILLWRSAELRGRLAWWVAVLVPFIAGIAVHVWFQARPDVRRVRPELPDPETVVLLPFLIVHLLGLAALPLLVLRPGIQSWKLFASAVAAMGAGALYWHFSRRYLPYGDLFPYSHNMLSPWGAFHGGYIGPLEVGDRPLILGWHARLVLTVLGCVAGAALVCRAVERWRHAPAPGRLMLFTMLQVPFLLIAPEVYDRYLLVLLPGALYVAMPEDGRLHWPPAIACVILFAVISLGLMHDWLAWNSARWSVGQRALEDRRLNPWDIEGGFEWDGWFSPGHFSDRAPGPRTLLTLPFTHDWFPQVTGRYALSFSVVPGTRELDSEPFWLWLAPGERHFHLIEALARPAAHPADNVHEAH
jgi:hypothetical protein